MSGLWNAYHMPSIILMTLYWFSTVAAKNETKTKQNNTKFCGLQQHKFSFLLFGSAVQTCQIGLSSRCCWGWLVFGSSLGDFVALCSFWGLFAFLNTWPFILKFRNSISDILFVVLSLCLIPFFYLPLWCLRMPAMALQPAIWSQISSYVWRLVYLKSQMMWCRGCEGRREWRRGQWRGSDLSSTGSHSKCPKTVNLKPWSKDFLRFPT